MEFLEAALTRAARGTSPIPDYSGFQEAIHGRVIAEQTRATTVHAMPSPTMAAAVTLLNRYHQEVRQGSAARMNLLRFKLLYSLFLDRGRAQDFMSSVLNWDTASDPLLDADNYSAATLRLKFMVAVTHGNREDASLLLGHLEEKDHDPGERAYLKALATFAAGQWDRVIKLVEQVPRDAIDRPRAAWLIAKVHATRGDVVRLQSVLEELKDRLSPCAWLHVAELLSHAEANAEAPWLTEIMPTRLSIGGGDPAYAEWAIFHVRLIAEMLEREREIGNAVDASGEPPAHEELIRDPILRRTVMAWAFEKKVAGEVDPGKVATRLDPLVLQGDMSAFRNALELLHAAGRHAEVVRWAKRYPPGTRFAWRTSLDIVSLVHASATLVDQRFAKKMEQLLEPAMRNTSATASRRLAIADQLAAMARLTFLAAATEVDRLQAAGDDWRDCGLVALGLFRSLEVELNNRLVRPLASSLNHTALQNQLGGEDRAVGAVLRLLRKARSGENLMLGDLRKLLEALPASPTDGDDTMQVRATLRSGFEALLSQAGLRGGALDGIGRMIDEAAVKRFRNAPAHGQFVRLSIAVEARDHVETGLERLVRWLPVTV